MDLGDKWYIGDKTDYQQLESDTIALKKKTQFT